MKRLLVANTVNVKILSYHASSVQVQVRVLCYSTLLLSSYYLVLVQCTPVLSNGVVALKYKYKYSAGIVISTTRGSSGQYMSLHE